MHLIHSSAIPRAYIEYIDKLFPGLSRIPLPKSADVYDSISAHPDIFIFQLNPKVMVVSRSLPKDILRAIEKTGVQTVISESIPHGVYPDTASLNACIVGKYIFHLKKITDKAILDLIEGQDIEFVNVNQGYARCSIAMVTKNAFITSDAGLVKIAKEKTLDVLEVSCGNVVLPDEKYGFLGGAMGVLPDGRVIFLGDIRKHPDFIEIDRFFHKHKAIYINMDGLDLFDGGSLMFI